MIKKDKLYLITGGTGVVGQALCSRILYLGGKVRVFSRTSKKLIEMKSKFSDSDVPLPPFWGGYRVKPQSIEFLSGRPNRLHDRFIYTRLQNETWKIERLSP